MLEHHRARTPNAIALEWHPTMPLCWSAIALTNPMPLRWSAITLKPPTPSHWNRLCHQIFLMFFFHSSLFASSFVSLEVNAGKLKIYCYHCNVCCSLLYWGGKTTRLQPIDVGFHKSSCNDLLLENLL